jgi:hypothetical protein
MDIDTLLMDADPARRIDLGGADTPTATRLYQQIVTLPPGRGGRRAAAGRHLRAWALVPSRPAVGRRRQARTVIIGLAAAGAAAAVAVALLPPAPHRPAQAGGSVAAILDAAAVTAARGADAGRPPGPGQYLYVKEVTAKGLDGETADPCANAPMTEQAWVSADGSGRQIGTFPARCARLNFGQTYPKGGLWWGLYGAVHANELPTDPAALQRAIVRRFEHGHSQPSATFVYAAAFLNAGSPPALRAALYRVIESLPGVQNLGPMTDRLGRHGQGVGLVTSGTRNELIFNPASTAVLERRMVAVGPPQPGNNMDPAGTLLQYTLYVREGVVDSITATPPPSPTSAG